MLEEQLHPAPVQPNEEGAETPSMVSARRALHSGEGTRSAAPRAADLLAILEAGPLPHAFMTRRQRQAMQDGIDVLIDYLDAVDVDPDLEDDGCAEPYMSRRETGAGGQHDTGYGGDECEDCHDHEPSLGSVGNAYVAASQATWAGGTLRDLEEECEDEGACIQSQPHDAEEPEASLGSPEIHHDQQRWSQGQGSRELDHDEHFLAAFGWEKQQALERAHRETVDMLRTRSLAPPRTSNIVLLGPDNLLYRGVAL